MYFRKGKYNSVYKLEIHMKYLFALLFSLAIQKQSFCQYGNYKKEFGICTGYNNPIGYLGVEYGYRPHSLNSILQYNIGFGFGTYQFFRFSQSINLYPLKEAKFTPFIRCNLSESIKQDIYFEANNITSQYKVSNNYYFSPNAALRIRTSDNQINFSFYAGYSFLINKPKIVFVTGKPDFLNEIKLHTGNRAMISVSVSSLLN